MKKKKTFAYQYPYLNYWIEDWGTLQIGNDYDCSFLMLFDEGGTCYEGDQEDTLDETFAKAEKFLREVDFPERFDKETIEALEEAYKNRD